MQQFLASMSGFGEALEYFDSLSPKKGVAQLVLLHIIFIDRQPVALIEPSEPHVGAVLGPALDLFDWVGRQVFQIKACFPLSHFGFQERPNNFTEEDKEK
ncbi:hypothetical protein I7I50_07565 [Histoplasma capsulatum G186AR]|uniref:Uncharacterized protein n=1 Tax=Ajellomyces capsulatus TaxID=5037 RepID=A0A8H7YWD5_AJECA|nr:hypothetical protein I7I52_09363 [Histoplasma capsulatum]QSS68228.1 hypothetical protein I7I50_07565 [Histoplasma capsulatum G186AR]